MTVILNVIVIKLNYIRKIKGLTCGFKIVTENFKKLTHVKVYYCLDVDKNACIT